MRPKTPPPSNSSRVSSQTPTDTFVNRPRPEVEIPVRHRPHPDIPTPPVVTPGQGSGSHSADSGTPPRVEISDLPDAQPVTSGGLTGYLLNQALLRNMQAADADGFRFVVGRRFVDIQDLGTVHVEFDAVHAAYRVTDLYRKLAPGPLIRRDPGETTWHLADQPPKAPLAKRPASDQGDTQIKRTTTSQPQHFRPLSRMHLAPMPHWVQVDTQGYYRRQEFFSSLPNADYFYGFKGPDNYWVQVDEPPAGFNGSPTHLTAWKDHQIWEAYGIHGQDITRLREEGQTGGSRPHWVKPMVTGNARQDLIMDGLRWLHPQKTLDEVTEHLRSYNLSPVQHVQLRKDLLDNPQQMPQWAEQHRLRSLDENDPGRFDQLRREIEPLIIPTRNGKLWRGDLLDFDQSLSRPFLDGFLASLGYLRNNSGCLYRLDIPGLFRADERTPFEFYNDGRMLPRWKHPQGATTQKPISATVSLKLLHEYGGNGRNPPDPEYLLYNNQKNKYPGKKTGKPDPDSGESDNEWSDASDVELDSERNYETTRHNQSFIFAYIIDTRKMEVVLREENQLLNLSAEKNGAWFPQDEFEALISASKKGIESSRLWLLDSTHTRAAKVDDVAEAGIDPWFTSSSIEERTHRGAYNQHEYDALIDKVAKAGKPILTLDPGKEWFAGDIVWPE